MVTGTIFPSFQSWLIFNFLPRIKDIVLSDVFLKKRLRLLPQSFYAQPTKQRPQRGLLPMGNGSRLPKQVNGIKISEGTLVRSIAKRDRMSNASRQERLDAFSVKNIGSYK
jgi:hypothetical protein